jgi:hypothetical protein
MAKVDSNVASASVNLIDPVERCATGNSEFKAKSRAKSSSGKVTLDSEEERVWFRAVRMILSCLTPYSGTIGRGRTFIKSPANLERASDFTAGMSAAGRQWSDFTRDELEHIAQDGEIARVLLEIIDDER